MNPNAESLLAGFSTTEQDYIQQVIRQGLDEDLGSGDHTSLACLDPQMQGAARLLVKSDGVIAGLELASLIFEQLDPSLEIEYFMKDGDAMHFGQEAFHVRGSQQSILSAERLVLNFMQRMSGIASITAQFVDAVSHTKAKLLDTRKTTPLLRIFEKWSVRIGGGVNHRMGLYDAMMIKDNHVDFCGGIVQAIDTAHRYQEAKGIEIPVLIETRNLEELSQVLRRGGVQRVMLDNFELPMLREAVDLVGEQVDTEATGGVNLQTIASIAETGVDYISVGALTHSAPSMDLSLKALK
jgi:nicotinate-nucleotide pyrophosphorylase (carboxylating)